MKRLIEKVVTTKYVYEEVYECTPPKFKPGDRVKWWCGEDKSWHNGDVVLKDPEDECHAGSHWVLVQFDCLNHPVHFRAGSLLHTLSCESKTKWNS